MRVDDKNIHLFYRSNCPPKGVKANKVDIIFLLLQQVISLGKCKTVDSFNECDGGKTGIRVQVDGTDPLTLQSDDPNVTISFEYY